MVMHSGQVLFSLAYFHGGSNKGNEHGVVLPTLSQSVRLCPRACCYLASCLYLIGDEELQIDGRAELRLGKLINFYSD